MSALTPPRYDLWPVSMLHALRLRGALLRCGPGFRGAAWPAGPHVRLAAIGRWLDDKHCAAFLTAAWVWEAIDDPGSPLRVAGPAGSRRHSQSPELRRCGLRLRSDETVRLGEFQVTTRLRTLIDLLHDEHHYGAREAQASHGLVTMILGAPDCTPEKLQQLVHERGKPHRLLAMQRLGAILDS